MKKIKFLRTDWWRRARLGKGRRKKQVWRNPRGTHNKIGAKKFGYPKMPAIGYGKARKEIGKIGGLIPVMVDNMKDLEKIGKINAAVISSKVGARKKIDIMKKAEEKGIKILNVGGKK